MEDKFLNKVSDILVKDTKIKGSNMISTIISPPYTWEKYNFITIYNETFHKTITDYSNVASNMIYFKPFVRDHYGVSDSEMFHLWKMYMNKLHEKLSSFYGHP